jgi:hypothetical protein
MTPHQQETYKSMVAISIEAIKFSALANGGAAVALLAYLGNVHGKATGQPVADLGYAMGLFTLGLLFSGFLIAASYLTQLRLYNEAFSSPAPKKRGGHRSFLYAAIAFFFISLVSFGAGALVAVLAWSAPAVVAPVAAPK